MLSEADARAIAIYLFTHKWLSAAYSEGMEDLLVHDILEAVNSNDTEED